MTEKINKKDNYHLIFALIFLAIVSVVSMMIGSSFIPLQRVLMYFINPNDSIDQFTLEVLRLPRITLCDISWCRTRDEWFNVTKCIEKSNCLSQILSESQVVLA